MQPWLRDNRVFFLLVPTQSQTHSSHHYPTLFFLSAHLVIHICTEKIHLWPLFISQEYVCHVPHGAFFSSLWSDSVDSLQQVPIYHRREKAFEHHRHSLSARAIWLKRHSSPRCAYTILLFLDTHFAQGSILYPLCSPVSFSKVQAWTNSVGCSWISSFTHSTKTLLQYLLYF